MKREQLVVSSVLYRADDRSGSGEVGMNTGRLWDAYQALRGTAGAVPDWWFFQNQKGILLCIERGMQASRVGMPSLYPLAPSIVGPQNCPKCGTWNLTGATCQQTRCLACYTEQCMSRGLARGNCGACHFGMLPGWSGNNDPERGRTSVRCAYTGCGEMAVYDHLPGTKHTACQKHGDAVLRRMEARRLETVAKWGRR